MLKSELFGVIMQAYRRSVGERKNGPQIIGAITEAVWSLKKGPQVARDEAVAKCKSCVHGEYHPKDKGRVAYSVARIRCKEGIFGFREWRPLDTFYVSIGGLARQDSKVRQLILDCEYWQKGG